MEDVATELEKAMYGEYVAFTRISRETANLEDLAGMARGDVDLWASG